MQELKLILETLVSLGGDAQVLALVYFGKSALLTLFWQILLLCAILCSYKLICRSIEKCSQISEIAVAAGKITPLGSHALKDIIETIKRGSKK